MTETAAEFWERRYAGKELVWSGRPNHWLEVIVGPLPAGRALDLGCGEGGDAVWLAVRGWKVTAVDVSPTAVSRTVEAAVAAGVADRVQGVQTDVEDSVPGGEWDLVNAQFLQSPLPLDRVAALRRAVAEVNPGGVLLVVDHAAAPPWSEHAHVVFPTVAETLAELGLDPASWSVQTAEARSRPATGPSGETGELLDNVIVLRRNDAPAPGQQPA